MRPRPRHESRNPDFVAVLQTIDPGAGDDFLAQAGGDAIDGLVHFHDKAVQTVLPLPRAAGQSGNEPVGDNIIRQLKDRGQLLFRS